MSEKVRMINRKCLICGKEITVKVYPDGSYEGGHYFGDIELDGKKIEYWECGECYNK